jgi:predicted ABC-type ATPase
MPNLYIIAGCNGAGKTTASFTILPEMLNCREFVNADSIAAAMAIQRVAARVVKGGHDIPLDVIERRYYRGIFNLINLYIPVCDTWMVVSNKDVVPELVGKGIITDQGKTYGNQ